MGEMKEGMGSGEGSGGWLGGQGVQSANGLYSRGNSRTAEVSQEALWEVYSLTVYFEIHPGRAVWRVLMASCGTFIYFPNTQ